MSAVTSSAHTPAPASGLRGKLSRSIVSGLVLGLVAAIIAGIVVHQLTNGGPRGGDDTLAAIYSAWFIFFLVGMGAANYPIQWARGRHETTHEEEMELAGRDEGAWRYFRFCTDHKVVGVQYFVLVMVLFGVGGIASWMIRLEQSQSGAKFFTPGTYNTLVGMHGIIMIATTIIMVSAAFGNYLIPIMIGAKDMAFPRLNALSFWVLFAAVPVLLSTIVLGGFPTGWTGYAPLADQAAVGMDAYLFTIIIFAISIALGAINVFVTVAKMRAPGMTWLRLPMFVWSVLLSTMLGLLVFPSFMAATVLTVSDRVFGTAFYQANMGGNNFLYEQMFWFMGHPEVYVIALPSIGVISEVVSTFTRKPLFASRLVLGGMIGIFVLSLVVWMHHIYWSGANTPLDAPMMLDTELISIPTGVIFLALIGTFWRGRVRMEAPMLFAMGFIVNFIIGGVTGLYLADVPTDAIFHGDMFVVAHFHFTLVGGAVFGFLAGFYYWFPKMTGRQLNQGLAKVHFWLFELGFLGVFLPLFAAGLKGEPRWQAFIDPKFLAANEISSFAAVLLVASVAVIVYNVIYTWTKGPVAAADPWGGRTLEWMVPNPVPTENFDQPVVVTSGPYDYGMGAGRRMGAYAPVMAGASGDAVAATGWQPPAADANRADRAKMGAGLWIVSDFTFVLAIFMAFVYLHALNTQGAFKGAAEKAPATIGQVLITLAAFAGAAAWSQGHKTLRAGNGAGARPLLVLAWVLTAAGLIGDLVMFIALKTPSPLHAFGSMVGLFVFYHAWHLIIGLAVATIALGRLFKGRMINREYIVQIVGWWLWWAAAASLGALILMTAIG
jgi:cytochrome c oxidase subunit 1